jgi:hypothetical protein
MSNDQHADWHFAQQYPFLYARKYRYYFQQHLLEGMVWAYGRFGLHMILLVCVRPPTTVALFSPYNSTIRNPGSAAQFSHCGYHPRPHLPGWGVAGHRGRVPLRPLVLPDGRSPESLLLHPLAVHLQQLQTSHHGRVHLTVRLDIDRRYRLTNSPLATRGAGGSGG